MMSKAKAKIMEKMMDGLMGDFNPETMIDMMLEKPILVYAEIALFKTDTGKLCCTINKLPAPQDFRDIKEIPIGTKLIVFPTVENQTTEATKNEV